MTITLNPKKILFLLLGLVIIFLFYLLFLRPSPPLSPDPASVPVSEAEPGTTKLGDLMLENQVVSDVLSPRGRETTVGQPNDPLNTTVVSQQDTVTVIIESNPANFEFQSLAQYREKYGDPEYELFGPWQSSGFKSFVFLQPGLIIVSHPSSGKIAEVWEITPNLTPEQFQSNFGSQFSTVYEPHRAL